MSNLNMATLEAEKLLLLDEVSHWLYMMQEYSMDEAMHLHYQQRMIDAENRLSITESLIAKEQDRCNKS